MPKRKWLVFSQKGERRGPGNLSLTIRAEGEVENEVVEFPASMMPMRQAEALVRGAVELWRLGRQVGGDDA